ncbi:MAG: SatD family protein [Oscillospiraceae bacterium]
MKKYAALLIDVKNSKEYQRKERTEIQTFIKETINVLNQWFEKNLRFSVVFSAGDEVQGLFTNPQAAYLYFRLFEMLVFPVRVRAGIGVGEWEIKDTSGLSTGQDGPAYHNARNAIEHADRAPGCSVLLFSGTKEDLYINSGMCMPSMIVGGQSNVQNWLYLLYELASPLYWDNVPGQPVLELLHNLMRQKTMIGYYTGDKKEEMRLPNSSRAGVRQPAAVDAKNAERYFYASSGKVRGTTTYIAEILNISVQSVDKTLAAGSVFEARNAVVSVLKLMGDTFKGETA